jgi:hypothetical protein
MLVSTMIIGSSQSCVPAPRSVHCLLFLALLGLALTLIPALESALHPGESARALRLKSSIGAVAVVARTYMLIISANGQRRPR